MSSIAIRVDNIGKQYSIGQARQRPDSLREWMTSAVTRAKSTTPSSASFWALRDVSFEVEQGEIVGVIGRNGAGKSTLLKILSQITEPTQGKIEIFGRVGSLLEVGTGFHPELTGRENIFLSGAMLGMRREEIARKLDEIIDFSGVEKFIDTPIKRYSSGMNVRLGFAVAAHLEPEILLVDEVLAVGDATFQRKCLGKMSQVAGSGRTVLFVSHNMTAIQSLCTRSFLIEQGELAFTGNTHSAVQRYLRTQSNRQSADFDEQTLRSGSGYARYTHVELLDEELNPTDQIGTGEGFYVDLTFETDRPLTNPSFGVVIRDGMGQKLAIVNTRVTYGEMPDASHGGTVRLHVERLDLLPGTYFLTFGLSITNEQIDFVENGLELDIVARDVYGTGRLPTTRWAVMTVPCSWAFDYR